MMPKKAILPAVCLFFASHALFAYTYNKTTVGPLYVEMEKPEEAMRNIDTPFRLKTVLKNDGETPIALTLTYGTIETIELIGPESLESKRLTRNVELPAKGKTTVEIDVVGRLGTLSVHYPVYLAVEGKAGGETIKAEVVLPFESTVTPNPNWPTDNPVLGKTVEIFSEMPFSTIPDGTGLTLSASTKYRAFWTWDKEPGKEHILPIGWTGSDPVSSAHVSRNTMTRGGVSRPSIQMHPSWRGGPGNVGVEYRIKLPETAPIVFSCFGAVRDVTPREAPSDGVTYRIAVFDGSSVKTITEKHVSSTTWELVEADLSSYAGKEIGLRLIGDPGPKRNTSCDSCFWGDPIVFAGKKPLFAEETALAARQAELLDECVAAMKTSKIVSGRPTKIFTLDGGMRAVVVPGEHGFLDGKIALGTPESFVVYHGVRVSIKDQRIAQWPTSLAASPCIFQGNPFKNDGTASWTQEIAIGDAKATMNYRLKVAGPALQLAVDCSEPDWVTSVQLGPTDKTPSRVYYGHGYCVVEPKAFTVGADGHRLSTSHIGVEYAVNDEKRISVLVASTTPPASLLVDAERNVATTVVRPGTTFTLLPGLNGMFDCAIRYRPLNPKKAAPGVKTKAGRFCFDIWGGTYRRHLDMIENAVRYGLTDSLFIVHSWQRYGYDNRLPDIWPPNRNPGTLEEMQRALELCDKAGILYGLHDNYIDIYPDAEGYGLDLVSFERNGQPRKAWFNRGIQARSYQFRPDKFLPFLNRNLDMMLPHLPQSCYFVDVFSSAGPNDFYDREGNFHGRVETNRLWGEGFDVIRKRLTEASRSRQNLPEEKRSEFHAVTISESGHDFLIGHLDGADCQFGRLDTKPNDFVSVVPCADWERIPWFDAVNHTTFSLHGVGYSTRYEGGTGRLLHGIASDDYMTAEMLTGHPPMVDSGYALRGAVRKYRLMQPTLRELADCEIASVDFIEGDIHRQKIVWKSPDGNRTTTVYVNRSRGDWLLRPENELSGTAVKKPFVLPPFGFLATGPAGVAAIFKTEEGGVAEFSRSPAGLFVNARQRLVEGLLPIRVELKPGSFEDLGDGRFRCDLLWTAKAAAPIDYSIFIHLVPVEWKKGKNAEGIKAVYGCEKKKPVTEWDGEIVTPMRPAQIGNDLPTGKYRLLVGLWSPGNGGRGILMGHDNDNRRYSVGIIDVAKNDEGKITALTIEEDRPEIGPLDALLRDRMVPPQHPVDFMALKTKGAFFLEGDDDRLSVTPLPDEPDTEIAVARKNPGSAKVTAVDEEGKKIRDVPSTAGNGTVIFTTKQGEFRYVVE